MYIRSPDTGWGNDVCYVYPDGDINNNEYVDVTDSYGCSPNTRYGNSAIDVGINGGVGNSYYAVVDNSYGYKMAALRARIGMIAAIT